ncbi:MAG: mercuric ion transporter MerT [Wenzhouxiangellaceae bacterium]
MNDKPQSKPAGTDRAPTGLLALGRFGAVLLSACCMLPFVLVLLGLGGAWLAHLHALYPFRWLFFAASAVALWLAWRRLYRPATECREGEICAVPAVQRRYRIGFWLVVGLVVLSAIAPYLLAKLMN